LKVFAAGLPVRDSPFEKAPGSISRTGCKDSAAVDGKCPCWRLRCTRRKPELRSATLVPLGRSPGSNSEWLTAHSRCEAQWLASDDGHVRPAGWRWRRREPGSSYNGRSRNAQHDSTSAWKPLGADRFDWTITTQILPSRHNGSAGSLSSVVSNPPALISGTDLSTIQKTARPTAVILPFCRIKH
jgi:hypothetical protein